MEKPDSIKYRPSIWDHYIKQSSLKPKESYFGITVPEIDTPPVLNTLYDIFKNQHFSVDVGSKGKFQLSGPQGPNLSPHPYDDSIPGYSAKYSFKF